MKELERASPRESFVEADVETASEASSEQDYSYEFAQMEVIMKTLGNNGTIRIICNLHYVSGSFRPQLYAVCVPFPEPSPGPTNSGLITSLFSVFICTTVEQNSTKLIVHFLVSEIEMHNSIINSLNWYRLFQFCIFK